MDLKFSAEEEAFRTDVRAFLAKQLTDDLKRENRLLHASYAEPDITREWARRLHAQGWLVPHWPTEYGGAGWSVMQQYIFKQEAAAAGAPPVHNQGVLHIGPVIIKYGTPKQKAFYLPRILSFEDYWAQGFSEPGAGSDLASLRTRAIRDGDHYVINGSKIWTTHAHFSNRLFALVRTSDTGRKQEGISFLLMDLDTPGITIRPIVILDGVHETNEVFFDNVRVPAENLIDEENKGWDVAKYLLNLERGGSMASPKWRTMLTRATRLIEAAMGERGSAAEIELYRARLAEIAIDLDCLEMLEVSLISAVQAGANAGVSASIQKLRASDIRQAIDEVMMDALGPEALRWNPTRPLSLLPESTPQAEEDQILASLSYFYGRAETIFGGSNEVQLNIIAKRGLGL
jgi:acyl-CoA dehydrogenase